MTAEQWELVAANRRLVWWAINRMGLTGQEAEDAYDPALSALMSAAKRWTPGRATFGYYAGRGILSRVKKWRDRRRPEPVRLEVDVAEPEVADTPPIPVESLPAREREAIDRVYLRGETQNEAASAMGCGRAVIFRLHRRAFERLRERMQA